MKDEGVVQRIAAALEHDGVETASEVLNPGADKLQRDDRRLGVGRGGHGDYEEKLEHGGGLCEQARK